jgi:hypothetical protein
VHPSVHIRSAGESIALAEQASTLSAGDDPRILEVLAAAYAGAGRFDQAVAVAKSAIAVASQQRLVRLTAQISLLLKLYEGHHPYIHSFTQGFGLM